MGLIADYKYSRNAPIYTERGSDMVVFEGQSTSKFITYTPPGGVGVYQVFYTVPEGMVFLAKMFKVINNELRINGVGVLSSGTSDRLDFDQPVKYEAGTKFSAFGNVATALVHIQGIEESQNLNKERNDI